MKQYEIEMCLSIEETRPFADAIATVFELKIAQIVDGPNGNALIIVNVPDDDEADPREMSRSFLLWLMERPGLMREDREKLDPILKESDTYLWTGASLLNGVDIAKQALKEACLQSGRLGKYKTAGVAAHIMSNVVARMEGRRANPTHKRNSSTDVVFEASDANTIRKEEK